MPIIGIGTVTKIKDDCLKIRTFEKFFQIGNVLTANSCRTDQWSSSDTSALTKILSNISYSTLNTLIIDEERPIFSRTEPEFNKIGLNSFQIEAVRSALRAKNYLLINAPHGTGRIATALRIIQAKSREEGTILVAPYFYDTINKVCEGLELLNIPYLVAGKISKIDEKFHSRHESVFFSDAKTLPDVDYMLDSIKVFVINSATKPYDIVFHQKFSMVILLESSNLPLLRSISSLSCGSLFILFGDPILDSDIFTSEPNRASRNSAFVGNV